MLKQCFYKLLLYLQLILMIFGFVFFLNFFVQVRAFGEIEASKCDGIATYEWYNEDKYKENGGYYKIEAASDFLGFSNVVNGVYDSNVSYDDFLNKTVKVFVDINLNNEPFNPIGFRNKCKGTLFKGTFDGQDHSIYNLNINMTTKDNVALFTAISPMTTLKNINLKSGIIKGKDCVGGLVGCAYNSNIYNCNSSANIIGHNYVGGIIGKSTFIECDYGPGKIINCSNNYSIQGNDMVGGIIGWSESFLIEGCYNRDGVFGESYVGGIVGYNSYSKVHNCHDIGLVSGESVVGGLVGFCEFSCICNSYSSSSVNGKASIGGIVGIHSGRIENCYNTSRVIGDNNVGGVVGINIGDICDSYSVNDIRCENNAGIIVGYRFSGNLENCCYGLLANCKEKHDEIGQDFTLINNKNKLKSEIIYINIDNFYIKMVDINEPIHISINQLDISVDFILEDNKLAESYGYTFMASEEVKTNIENISPTRSLNIFSTKSEDRMLRKK